MIIGDYSKMRSNKLAFSKPGVYYLHKLKKKQYHKDSKNLYIATEPEGTRPCINEERRLKIFFDFFFVIFL